ncbi:MAG: phosphotransferase [Planctomycetota bacterium]
MSALDAERFSFGDARGVRFGALPEAVAKALPRWIEGRDHAGLKAIKAGRVYRTDAWLLKFSGPRRGLRDAFRPSPAVRVARTAARITAIRTPRPLLALEWRRGAFVEESLYVGEFVAGRRLHDLWGKDEAAVRAFPRFMAAMHGAYIVHGDFHPMNVVWNGAEWVLIDLDSIRGPLHVFRLRGIAMQQWARTLRNLRFDAGVRALLEEYLRIAGVKWPADDAWREIERRAHAMPPIDWSRVDEAAP